MAGGRQPCENAQSEPKFRRLIALADDFDGSIEYLVGRTDKRKEIS